MKKQPEVTAQTRQALIDAFWKLYCEKGIDKITVREITAVAGYNRGTFYEYFYDVYDVLQQIEDGLMSDIRLERQDGMPLSFDELVNVFESNAKYLSVLFGERGDPKFIHRTREEMKKNFYRMAESNGVKMTFRLQLAIQYHINAVTGCMVYWWRMEKRPRAAEYVKVLGEVDGGARAKLEEMLGCRRKETPLPAKAEER